MPSLVKKAMARTMSSAGKTTFSTTVLIWVAASVQVLSTAEATSPAAKAGAQQRAATTMAAARIRNIFLNFILIFLPVFI